MKKFLIVMLAFVMILQGCGNDRELPLEEPVSNVEEPVAEVNEEVKASDDRPIAIMIDNDEEASRPHAGLEDAYLLYEMYVEGSATRIMALYKDAQTEKIGPVRSSRHYFLDYALENDAIYVHFGWSPQAQTDIYNFGVNNINGVLGGDGNIFWRERKFANDYHSAYTNIEKIKNYAENTKKYRMTTQKSGLRKMKAMLDPEGDPLTEITLHYSGFYRVKYAYDKETQAYKRYINGSGHITQGNVHLAASNLIIQIASNYSIAGDDKGRQNLNTTGSGSGYYLTNGTVRKITWSKNSRTEKTVYKYESGEEIIFNPGQTWIQIVPPSMNLGI